MKKFALMFALVGVASISAAQDTKPVEPAKAEKVQAPAKTETALSTKTRELEAEIVSFDAMAKTVTIKGTPDNKTVPVDAKAVASVKELKAGDKVTLLCRDNEKGELQAVAGVKQAPKKS